MEAGKKLQTKLSLEEKKQLVEAIHHAESGTSGEIKVHFSYREKEDDILQSAKHYFAALGMHETSERNAMLLYVNPGLKKFCVFGDEGIHQKVKQKFWDKLIADVTHAIRERSLIHGVVHAVEIMGKALHEHYPAAAHGNNQLPDDISESD